MRRRREKEVEERRELQQQQQQRHYHHDGGRDWSDIPELILFSIIMRLGLVDFSTCSRVCHAWRSISRDAKKEFMSSRPPLLLLFHNMFDPSYRLYNIVERQMIRIPMEKEEEKRGRPRPRPRRLQLHNIIINFSCGYLITCDRSRKQLFLVDPLTGEVEDEVEFPKLKRKLPYQMLAFLTSPPCSSSLVHDHNNNDNHSICVLTVFNQTTLYYCQPGEVRWKAFKFAPEHHDDLFLSHRGIVLDGKVYIMMQPGKFFVFNFSSTRSLLITTTVTMTTLLLESLPLEMTESRVQLNIVQSRGEIFALLGLTQQWIIKGFLVYRLDLSAKTWVKVTDIGGRIFFKNKAYICMSVLSYDPSTSTTLPESYGRDEIIGSGNCIYFFCYRTLSLGVFHMHGEKGDGWVQYLHVPFAISLTNQVLWA